MTATLFDSFEGEPRDLRVSRVCCYSLKAKSFECCWPQVVDVWNNGVGLRVKRSFPTDDVLIIEVHSVARRRVLPLAARVIHSILKEDGNWLVACEFNRRLRVEELHFLLMYL